MLFYIKKLSKMFEKAYGEQLILREITDFIKNTNNLTSEQLYSHYVLSVDRQNFFLFRGFDYFQSWQDFHVVLH